MDNSSILFTIYLLISFQAHGVDSILLRSDEQIVISNLSDRIEFVPQSGMKASALIFYHGGMVEPKAYVPMARNLAENGHKVVILKLPSRTAASQGQKRDLFLKTIALVSEGKDNLRWILAGHSKGGALAAEFVWNNDGVFDKLPKDTSLVKIEGGNHSQFGYYGFQIGDNRAIISRDEQNKLLVESLLQVLNKVNKR